MKVNSNETLKKKLLASKAELSQEIIAREARRHGYKTAQMSSTPTYSINHWDYYGKRYDFSDPADNYVKEAQRLGK